MTVMPRPLVYFLCTGNSCRSQMAEGFARHLAGDGWDVASAGVEPSAVSPKAIAVMREAGIDVSDHTSKAIDPELLGHADVVITLCGDANDRCPSVPTARRRLHWDLPDPARAQGAPEEQMAAFRVVRDDIRRRVSELMVGERQQQPEK